jgi:hypothetical protein
MLLQGGYANVSTRSPEEVRRGALILIWETPLQRPPGSFRVGPARCSFTLAPSGPGLL